MYADADVRESLNDLLGPGSEQAMLDALAEGEGGQWVRMVATRASPLGS